MGTGGFFPGGKAAGRETDSLSQPGAEDKNKWISLVILHGVHRDFTLTLQV
jgi:hypothetical protein